MELSIMLVVRNKGEVHNQGGEVGEGVALLGFGLKGGSEGR